jgi:hypothetical protein
VLRADAEVGVDTFALQASAQSAQASRTRGPVGLGPTSQVGGARRRRKVGWMRQAPHDFGHEANVTRLPKVQNPLYGR